MTLCLLTYYAAGQSLLVAAYLGQVLFDKPWRDTRAIRGLSVWAPLWLPLWLPLFPLVVPPLVAHVVVGRWFA
jgi:hypothetical protein